MKTKTELLGKMLLFTKDLTGENLSLANVAMIETEVQIDIRDSLVISKNVLTSIYDSIINND